jgi:hypothetical protein
VGKIKCSVGASTERKALLVVEHALNYGNLHKMRREDEGYTFYISFYSESKYDIFITGLSNSR